MKVTGIHGQRSIFYWHDMEEKQKEELVTLQTVLTFVTATDRIPASGFSSKLQLLALVTVN